MTTQSEQASINKYDLLFESRITRAEATYEALLRSEERIENRFNRIDSRITQLLRMMIIGFIGLAGLIAKAVHWF